MIANILTLSRIALVPPIMLLISNEYYRLSYIFIIFALLTDFLDGFFARRYNQESFVGTFLDPLADKIIYISFLLLFVEKGYISYIPVLLILFREFIALGYGPLVLLLKGNINAGKVKNSIQFLSVVIIVIFRSSIYSNLILWASVIMTFMSAISIYLQNIGNITKYLKEFKPSNDRISMLANIVTLSRLLFIFPIYYLALKERLIEAALVSIIAALTDILDGKIARKSGTVSNFGTILDPVIDKVLYISILILFLHKGYISTTPLLFIIFRELIITGLRSVCLSTGELIPASKLGKLKALNQNISVQLIFLLQKSTYTTMLIWLIVGITLASSVNYLKVMIRIIKEKKNS